MIISKLYRNILISIEKRLLIHAISVNVVSEAFNDYFREKGLNTNRWTFYPHGIDAEFNTQSDKPEKKESLKKTVIYAGNIGTGQSLHKIIPDTAKILEKEFNFLIIGDGADKQKLSIKISELSNKNIKLLEPVGRDILLDYYNNSDILFLHLSNIEAFNRVLPSKIFEYGSLKKPIVAGVSGYAENFLKKNLHYTKLFKPENVDECVKSIRESTNILVEKNYNYNFFKKYSRKIIMQNYAKHILNVSKNIDVI